MLTRPNKNDSLGLDAVIMWGRNRQGGPGQENYFENLAEVYAREYEQPVAPTNLSVTVNAPVAHIFHVESIDDVQKALATPNIDTLIYVGHAGAQALYLSNKDLRIADVAKLNMKNIKPGAYIGLYGCDTAGSDVLSGQMNIAQAFANHFHARVEGARGGLSFGAPRFGFDFAPGLLRADFGMRFVYPQSK